MTATVRFSPVAFGAALTLCAAGLVVLISAQATAGSLTGVLLAVGSVGAGWFLIVNYRFSNFLGPVVGFPPDKLRQRAADALFELLVASPEKASVEVAIGAADALLLSRAAAFTGALVIR